MKTAWFRLVLVLSFALFIPLSAPALTPRGRLIAGVVQRVDAQTKEVQMRRDGSGEVIAFVCAQRAVFFANGESTTPVILKVGAHVEVSRHVPFFGKPFVTRVRLLQPTPSK